MADHPLFVVVRSPLERVLGVGRQHVKGPWVFEVAM
jgi:hypothetical protein